jgi:hypothetical protein
VGSALIEENRPKDGSEDEKKHVSEHCGPEIWLAREISPLINRMEQEIK